MNVMMASCILFFLILSVDYLAGFFGDFNTWAILDYDVIRFLSILAPPWIYDALADLYMLHLATGDFQSKILRA